MVQRFWRLLVNRARLIFNEARADTDRWLTAVPLPLETQIRDHKAQLQSRLDSLAKINLRGSAMDEEIVTLQKQRQGLESQIAMITQLIVQVRDVGPSSARTAPLTSAVAANGEPGNLQQVATATSDREITIKMPRSDTPIEFLTTQKLDLNAKA